MYHMRATEQYHERNWCRLWLLEHWKVFENGAVIEYTDEIFMCPLHRINYKAFGRLEEMQRDLQPPPETLSEVIFLPSDGTGGLAVKLHYHLGFVACASQRKEKEPGFEAGVKRRRSF
jgi:hypothetical protein